MEKHRRTSWLLLVAGVLSLAAGSCASQRKLGSVQREQMAATLRLPADRQELPTVPTGGVPRRDTLRVTDLSGREMILMQAIRDDETGEMVAAERLDAAVVTARFRNVAERHGRIDLEFQVVVPQQMQDSRWQLRLHPDLYLLEDSLRLDDVVITGADSRRAQLRGYEQYEKFLGRIVTDTLAFVDLRNLEIFLERNIPQVYALKTDSTFVSDEQFESYFGVSEQEAVEHYTNKFLRRRNERRKADRERMFRRYVKAPIVTDGIRLDTVIRGSSGEFIYNYIQTIATRPRLRKADIRLCGEIFEQDRRLYTVPQSEALTFYISSVSAFVDGTERYKTVIISRNLEANTACNIDFRTGRYEIEEKLGPAQPAAQRDLRTGQRDDCGLGFAGRIAGIQQCLDLQAFPVGFGLFRTLYPVRAGFRPAGGRRIHQRGRRLFRGGGPLLRQGLPPDPLPVAQRRGELAGAG